MKDNDWWRLDAIAAATTLEELYALVPEMNCRGGCHVSCGPIAMSREESRRVDAALGKHLPNRIHGWKLEPCSALTVLKRCSVYEARPMICRLWGPSTNMPCTLGCSPVDDDWLTHEESAALLRRAEAIGGKPDYDPPEV